MDACCEGDLHEDLTEGRDGAIRGWGQHDPRGTQEDECRGWCASGRK